MRTLFLILELLLNLPESGFGYQAKPIEDVLGQVQSIRNQVSRIAEDTEQRIREKRALLKTEAEREQMRTEALLKLEADLQPLLARALEQIEFVPEQRKCIEPLTWLATMNRGSKTSDRAAELLAQLHLTAPATVELAVRHKKAVLRWVRPMLEAQWNSKDLKDSDRVRVLHALATQLQMLAETPASIAELSERERAVYEAQFGAVRMQELQHIDIHNAETEMIQAFELLKQQFGDRIVPRTEVTYGRIADAAIYSIQNLSVGKPSPDLEGNDLDGNPMKLSDFRGKVVLLCFWGSWCGPCMELIPHERKLAETLDPERFAIVGVNSDESLDKLKPILQSNGITWRSFWCGTAGPTGEIPMSWNVTGWPTTYVIDKNGIIRAKHSFNERTDQLIQELMNE